ncbi:hypothetical protein Bpfe_017682, partial [Biomphalaria pfeifferi]
MCMCLCREEKLSGATNQRPSVNKKRNCLESWSYKPTTEYQQYVYVFVSRREGVWSYKPMTECQ